MSERDTQDGATIEEELPGGGSPADHAQNAPAPADQEGQSIRDVVGRRGYDEVDDEASEDEEH